MPENHTGALHILKLCVGAESVEDLINWQKAHFGAGSAVHVTRMWPKRADEVLAGGSLYWVIKGVILARQQILDLQPVTGADGVTRCAFVLDKNVIRTEAAPRRPFQGWRYFPGTDAPRDLRTSTAREEPLPRELQTMLSEIGLR
ncbi:hypothetical protein SAMN05877809_108124 [Rhodobacter sp. JA431]|uniref:DUF1489 family protein n=1 Tax=Rhodobacter sp. JA431 TaxID=570013 RepID=UPI000BC40D6B|nr:DUF1489 domain-containing protein [Rhodobacter sp. JA431]SOC16210.1 hypothetical protein SAMN05877809_108124 [Rhodobacter sp. JA431]